MTREEATRRNTMPNELKPCPFCGGEAFVWRTSHRTWIECENYNVDTHRVAFSSTYEKEVIEAWNRRYGNGMDKR